MIDLLFTFSAVADSKTVLPDRRFDDSQDCLTLLRRQMASSGRLWIGQCDDGSGLPAPWRSL